MIDWSAQGTAKWEATHIICASCGEPLMTYREPGFGSQIRGVIIGATWDGDGNTVSEGLAYHWRCRPDREATRETDMRLPKPHRRKIVYKVVDKEDGTTRTFIDLNAAIAYRNERFAVRFIEHIQK